MSLEYPFAHIFPFKGKHPKIHSSAWIAPGAQVIGNVTLGEDASVWHNAVLRGDSAEITVGARTNIQDLCLLHADPGQPTTLGDDVTIGHSAVVHGCTIGNRCLIGMGAVILNGAFIDDDSIVAAGSLVAPGKVFPPRSLILGSPAKVVRQVTPSEIEGFLESARHYVQNAKDHSEELTIYAE